MLERNFKISKMIRRFHYDKSLEEDLHESLNNNLHD